MVDRARQGIEPGLVGVAGQDPLDPDAVDGEERRGVEQEASARRAPLVGERCNVGDPNDVRSAARDELARQIREEQRVGFQPRTALVGDDDSETGRTCRLWPSSYLPWIDSRRHDMRDGTDGDRQRRRGW
jgi:hypothetical protein